MPFQSVKAFQEVRSDSSEQPRALAMSFLICFRPFVPSAATKFSERNSKMMHKLHELRQRTAMSVILLA